MFVIFLMFLMIYKALKIKFIHKIKVLMNNIYKQKNSRIENNNNIMKKLIWY